MKSLSKSVLGLLAVAATALSHAATVYTYDELNRLTKVVYDDGRSIGYTYDAAGNLLSTVKTGGTSTWCGRTLNFAGNQLPAGWQQVQVRSGPGIVNERLQGAPVDSGAEVNSPSGAVTAGTDRVVAQFRVNTAYSYWGQSIAVSYQLASGRVLYVGLSHARYNHGDGNLVMTVQDLSNTWGSLAATGSLLTQAKLPGYRHGLHEVTVTVQDGQMNMRVKNLDSPAIADLNFAAALPATFKLADIRKALFNVYTTTDGAVWGDDVSWHCMPPSTNSLSDDFNRPALDETKWSSVGYRYEPDIAVKPEGSVTVQDGVLELGYAGGLATFGKQHFKARKIVVEARIARTGSGEFPVMLVSPANLRDRIVISETPYCGIGFFGAGGGIFEFTQKTVVCGNSAGQIALGSPAAVGAWMEYRMTVEGNKFTMERGPTLQNITQSATATLGQPVDGHEFFLYFRTGSSGNFYGAKFDWVRVIPSP